MALTRKGFASRTQLQQITQNNTTKGETSHNYDYMDFYKAHWRKFYEKLNFKY